MSLNVLQTSEAEEKEAAQLIPKNKKWCENFAVVWNAREKNETKTTQVVAFKTNNSSQFRLLYAWHTERRAKVWIK